MNVIVGINKKQALIIESEYNRKTHTETRKIISVIDNEPSLVKYLIETLRLYELSKDNGYFKFENRPCQVYLHRIILDYYSKFDTKLFTVMNSEYEVNHKNFNKWDNRIENFEIVTRRGNERHKNNLDYQDEVVMTTEELVQIQEGRKKKRQYFKNKKDLNEISEVNVNILKNDREDINIELLFENLYISFNNVTECKEQIIKKRSSINTFIRDIDSNIIELLNAHFICLLHTRYNSYRARKIIKNNLHILKKYYKNKEFRELCHKYKILNFIDKRYEYKCLRYTFKKNGFIDELNTLIAVYKLILRLNEEQYYTFYKNQFFITFDIKSYFLTRGIYNSFKVMYYTGLLNKIKVNKRINDYGHLSSCTCLSIPFYTEDFFTTTVLLKTKRLLSMNLSTITHTILTKNEGEEVAEKVYKNSRLKEKTEISLISIEDIKSILSSTTITEKLNYCGFIKVKDIREELKKVNEERKSRGKFSLEISDSDDRFIKRMIRNIIEIKDVMKQQNIDYVVMNNKTRDKIKRHQRKNNIICCEDLRFNQNERVILLKKLYVKPKKRKKSNR